MAFDFLPDKKQQENTDKGVNVELNGGQGSGFIFGQAKKVFFYDYLKNHLQAHNEISIPLNIKDFLMQDNFHYANKVFGEARVKSEIQDGFYGENTDYEKLLNGYTLFQAPKVLEQAKEKLKKELDIDFLSQIEKKKIRFNDKNLGIFSFDKAASGMEYVFEYVDENNEKVNIKFIEKIDGKFYNLETKKEVFQRIAKLDNGAAKITSNIKKSFIDFEVKKQMNRSVEIYINLSISYSTKVDQFVHNGLAGSLMAEELLKKGFKVKVNAVLANLNNQREVICSIIPVKNWNEPLDLNALAYVTSDPRFYRFNGFKNILKCWDNSKLVSPSGLGSIIFVRDMAKLIEEQYLKETNKPVAESRLYFGGSLFINEVLEEVETAKKLLLKKYSNES